MPAGHPSRAEPNEPTRQAASTGVDDRVVRADIDGDSGNVLPVQPPRPRPIFLAASAFLYAGWIAFLAWMAFLA